MGAPPPLGHARLRRRVLAVVAWSLAALVLLDMAVGLATRPPADPRREGSALQTYFDYGTSIEAKLRRAIGRTPGEAAPIISSGWLAKECDRTVPDHGRGGVSVYGMSFSNRVADQLAAQDPALTVDKFAGPGAPLNHSYACFLRRDAAGRDHNPVQVLGVLASSIRRLTTLSGISTSFEQPQPFTYPRYTAGAAGGLTAIPPPILSEADLRRVLATPGGWRDYVAKLDEHDDFASPWLANGGIADWSVTLRLIRRAWGQHYLRAKTDAIRGNDDFSGDPTVVPAMRAIMVDFAARVRRAGKRPVIILFEDRGYEDAFRRSVVPTLVAHGIPYVLTSDVVQSGNPANFMADGHFTPAIDARIAAAALPLVTAAPANSPVRH